VTQGTATPVHFWVIDDNSQLPANVIETLMFNLTMLYYNWSGPIRVPAPLMYAHKLAMFGG